MMSYAAAFKQDLERLRQIYERVNLSPLGCGALAGNPFRIDRNMIAEELGFSGITLNSMNTSADRDYIIEFLVWNSMFTNHLSRWAEDLIIYSTSEFAFLRLADAYSTGSSLMPNKHNGDSLELLRGKSGRAFGQMAGLMMVSSHNMPIGQLPRVAKRVAANCTLVRLSRACHRATTRISRRAGSLCWIRSRPCRTAWALPPV
jgi:argininosuccinate lyase